MESLILSVLESQSFIAEQFHYTNIGKIYYKKKRLQFEVVLNIYSCLLFSFEFRFPYKKYTKTPMANHPKDSNCAS